MRVSCGSSNVSEPGCVSLHHDVSNALEMTSIVHAHDATSTLSVTYQTLQEHQKDEGLTCGGYAPPKSLYCVIVQTKHGERIYTSEYNAIQEATRLVHWMQHALQMEPRSPKESMEKKASRNSIRSIRIDREAHIRAIAREEVQSPTLRMSLSLKLGKGLNKKPGRHGPSYDVVQAAVGMVESSPFLMQKVYQSEQEEKAHLLDKARPIYKVKSAPSMMQMCHEADQQESFVHFGKVKSAPNLVHMGDCDSEEEAFMDEMDLVPV